MNLNPSRHLELVPSHTGTSLSPTSGLHSVSPSHSHRSRRSSVISSGSSGGFSKSRSLLSTGDGSTGPLVDGNLHIVTGIDCGELVVQVAHSENGSSLLAGLWNGQIKVFNALNGNLMASLDNEEILKDSFPLSRMKCKPVTETGATNLVAATYVSGHLRIWNHSSGQCIAEASDEDQTIEYLCLSYNPFVDVLAVGQDNGGIKLYDEKTMQVVSLLQKSESLSKVNGHTDRVLCLSNHPTNPHEFVSSGWDNTLQFWDARCPNAVRSVYGILVCGEGLTFDRKGKEVLVASWTPENPLQLLDYATGALIDNYQAGISPHYFTCAQFMGKDLIVSGAANKGKVTVVDKHKKEILANLSEVPNVFDLDVVKKAPPGGGHRLTITSNNNIVTLECKK